MTSWADIFHKRRHRYPMARVKRWVHDAYWALRHRLDPRHRYHVMRTGLPPGYWDSDTRILCAVMEELTKFVDGTTDTVDWASEPGHANAWAIMTEAVAWWRRAKAQILDGWASDLSREEEQALQDEADSQLARVMLVRQYLWWP